MPAFQQMDQREMLIPLQKGMLRPLFGRLPDTEQAIILYS
jgi:hypothetical protein